MLEFRMPRKLLHTNLAYLIVYSSFAMNFLFLVLKIQKFLFFSFHSLFHFINNYNSTCYINGVMEFQKLLPKNLLNKILYY